jgi:leader peptidase (prepilin peptidase)/N-methyltransferase
MSMGVRLYLDFVVFVLGAGIGSFLNVCIHRMPRDESIVSPPSHCPHCNARIRWMDNIPLLSYMALRGKCRYCRAQISPRYVVVELLTALLFLGVWLKYPLSWLAPIYWVVVGGLIAGTFIDLEHYIIPDEITVGGVVVGFVASIFVPSLHGETFAFLSGFKSLLGILIGSGLVLWVAIFGELIFRKEAMGFGDVKLTAMIGAFFGWQAAVFALAVASVIGSVVGSLWVLLSRERRAIARPACAGSAEKANYSLDAWSIRDEMDTHAMRSSIPYGPFLAIAAVLWVFMGEHVRMWYAQLLK